MPFDQIFDAVASGRADAGLIIHEGQLTYAKDGFVKIVDLGEWWKNKTGLPLPLGGNIVRKDMDREVRKELSDIMYASIDYGLKHRADAVEHSMPLARGWTKRWPTSLSGCTSTISRATTATWDAGRSTSFWRRRASRDCAGTGEPGVRGVALLLPIKNFCHPER